MYIPLVALSTRLRPVNGASGSKATLAISGAAALRCTYSHSFSDLLTAIYNVVDAHLAVNDTVYRAKSGEVELDVALRTFEARFVVDRVSFQFFDSDLFGG